MIKSNSKLTRHIVIGALMAAVCLAGRAAESDKCSIRKQAGVGDKGDLYILENSILTVTVNPGKGGGVEGIVFKPTGKMLALPSAQAEKQGSFLDRIYRQYPEGQKTIIEVEDGFREYPYEAAIVKETPAEVALKVSCQGRSAAFRWLTVSKTYTLKKNIAALYVEHAIANGSAKPEKAGLWVPTFIRPAGTFSERASFFTPTPNGVRVIAHPGKDAKTQGNWMDNPPQPWKAVVGISSRAGMVAVLEPEVLSSYYDWYRQNGFISTFEWMIRQQEIPAQGAFVTQYVLLPLSDFRRVDGVLEGNAPGVKIACGILFPPRVIKSGEELDLVIDLVSTASDKIALSAALIDESGAAAQPKTPLPEVILESGCPVHVPCVFSVPRDGIYRIEVKTKNATVARSCRVGPGPAAETVITALAVKKKGDALVYPILHDKLEGYKDIEWRPARDTTAKAGKQGVVEEDLSKLSAKDKHRRETLKMYRGLDDIETISDEVVTPHVPWMKPSALGKLKTLYMVYLSGTGVADTRRRSVIECAQRLDMDYTYIPLLKRMATFQSVWKGKHADDLEAYILDRAREELAKDYAVVVVEQLDFKGVQDELVKLLLDAANGGKGVVFAGCANLPPAITDLVKQNAKPLPANFYSIPELNKKLVLKKAMPVICQVAEAGKGRIVVLDLAQGKYPCVPADRRSETYSDVYGKGLPYWEYLWLPVLKSIVWASGKQGGAELTAVFSTNDQLVATATLSGVKEPTLEVTFKDPYNQIDLVKTVKLSGAADKAQGALSLADMRGGLVLADCRLLDAKGKVLDFGSYAVKVPETVGITNIAFDKRVYKNGEKINAVVSLDGAVAGCKITAEVEDTWNRRILRLEQDLSDKQPSATFSFSIEKPLSVLHRLFVEVKRGDATLARGMEEFSLPFNTLPIDDLFAYMWYSQPRGLKRWKDFGFDCLITSYDRQANTGILRAINNMNIRPYGFGSGVVGVNPSHKGDHSYSGFDLVRDPCLSDPEYKKKRVEALRKNADLITYFGIYEHHMLDEFHLGPAFCFSEHCLKNFREYLKEQYASLDALNAEWDTKFAAWDEVKPLSVQEMDAERDTMTSWLDHRMFMNLVVARWILDTKTILREHNPLVTIGLSGTGNPDTTYNWWEIMKITDFLANYGGIQNDLIRSFQLPNARTGSWTGGYQPSWVDAERYARTAPWFGVFNNNRAYFYWHGSSCGYNLFGDLRPSRTLKYIVEELKELKSGTAKLLFSSERLEDGVALHYSQNSMFAAMGSIGSEFWSSSLDSWKYLLDDLGLGFHFVSYEQLAKDGLDPAKIKVFILPLTISISKSETVNLKKYVEAGGTLLADYAPGIYDEHGKRAEQAELLALFGVKREKSEIRILECKLKVKANPDEKLVERESVMRYGEEGLVLTTGKAYADTGKASVPAVVINRVGKGKAVLLNCVIGDYARVTLGGEGGETSTIGRGDPAITTPIRELVADILRGASVERKVRLETAKGEDFQPLVTTVRYADGAARYVGILKNDDSANTNSPADYVPLTVRFGQSGHLYDVRGKKYLGEGDMIKTEIAPAVAKLFAIMPYKVERVDLKVAGSYHCGKTAEIPVMVKASVKDVGNHVLRIEVIGPDKQARECYAQNLRVMQGAGVIRVPFALNDPSGQWEISATDVVSGVSGKARLTLERRKS